MNNLVANTSTGDFIPVGNRVFAKDPQLVNNTVSGAFQSGKGQAKGKGATKKGYIKNLKTGKTLTFQYNPPDFTYGREANYTEMIAPGMNYPIIQFVSGTVREVEVPLFFFSKGQPDENSYIPNVQKFINALLPAQTNKKKFKKPPEVLFSFANFTRRCVVTAYSSANMEYNAKGKPVNTTITLTLKQVGVK